MLEFLKIKNLALLESVELDFRPGFTAVTGETGAGKSVLLGALSLLAGVRSDKSIIKQGAGACEIEAILHFKDPERMNSALQAMNLPTCEDDSLILKRSIFLEQSPRIYVNGALVTQGVLKELGAHWIDFHGPGEPQKLFHERYQLHMLDLYATPPDLLQAYQKTYQAWRGMVKKAAELEEQGQLSADELHFIQSQIKKIDSLSPTADSMAELEQSFMRISRAGEIAELTARISGFLGEEEGALPALQEAFRSMQCLLRVDPSTKEMAERLNSAIIEIQDLSESFSALTSELEMSPESVQSVQDRMALWLEIQRQFGPTPEAVLKKRQQLWTKVENQSDIHATLANLNAQAKAEEDALKKLADRLHEARLKGAEAFSKRVQPLLKSLGFKKAQFEIKVEAEELKGDGGSRVSFLLAPNPGQAPLPLSKIASSGEAARVMLALKAILAEVDHIPLLVFDEVDANVGGEIATHVAQELSLLSKNHQVFCITHLAQVASKAHHHWVVEKIHQEESTEVKITELLTLSSRKEEIARMLGDRKSKSALSHAEELLTV